MRSNSTKRAWRGVLTGLALVGLAIAVGVFRGEGVTTASTSFRRLFRETAVEDLELFFRVGLALANEDRFPNWNEGTEFRAIRDQMMTGSR